MKMMIFFVFVLTTGLVHAQHEKLIEQTEECIKQEDFHCAKNHLKLLLTLELDPYRRSIMLNNMGTVYWRLGHLKKAEKVYTRGIKQNSENLELYHNRSDLRLTMGNESGAIRDLRRILDRDSLNIALYKKAEIRYHQKKYEKAKKDFLTYYVYTGEYHCMIRIGEILEEEGKTEEAKAVYKQVYKTHPTSTTLLIDLAKNCIDQGRYQRAFEYANLALSYNETKIDTHLLFAELYTLSGNKEGTCQHWKKALELGHKLPPTDKMDVMECP